MPADDLAQKFPQLSDLEHVDVPQRIEAFQSVLDQLQHELDDNR
ncbi:hypothetical protein BHAP_0204 [Bifidobacterium hapali]|uniref:Uncharacterized protein n=1 Tax=Bifidobacterium hapali TaxID=1630172 RepID=A0A261G4K0_9BIFI|nr:hypothetical protein [Bifidobacterium hapali]OZG66342.1 hypothetical protein BHAP_0204 [Bifidobacterium hapali]